MQVIEIAGSNENPRSNKSPRLNKSRHVFHLLKNTLAALLQQAAANRHCLMLGPATFPGKRPGRRFVMKASFSIIIFNVISM